jgi:hypothetical protein
MMIKRFYVVAYSNSKAGKVGSFHVTNTSWLPDHKKAYGFACEHTKEKFGDGFSIDYFNYLGWTK